MKKLLLALGLIVSLSVNAAQAESHSHPNYHQATLICKNLAEDSAGSVRLVEYSPETNTIIYKCERNGY